MVGNPSSKRAAWGNGFLCGVARMVAMIARDYQEWDHAWNYLAETGRTLDEFRAAKVEGQDMRVITKLFRTYAPKP